MLAMLLAASLAAPVPKAKEAGLYFPVKEGTKLVMLTKVGNKTYEATETVTKVESDDGKYRVSVERVSGERTTTAVYEVSGKGVFHVEADGKPSVVVPLIKTPAKEGDTWEVKWVDEPGRARTTYTVGKEETVEVPAGKFTALRVDCEIDLGNGQMQKNTVWHAAGVGVVKIESEVGKRTITQELKEFTPGK